MAWAWSAILIGSLLTIVGFARAGSVLFWKSTAMVAPVPQSAEQAPPPDVSARPAEIAPALIALAMLAMFAVFAGPIAAYLENTANQIFDRAGYVAAVLLHLATAALAVAVIIATLDEGRFFGILTVAIYVFGLVLVLRSFWIEAIQAHAFLLGLFVSTQPSADSESEGTPTWQAAGSDRR